MKNDLSKVKVGDWIWTVTMDWVKVTSVSAGLVYPMEAGGKTYTLAGFFCEIEKNPQAFTEPPVGFEAGPKPCEFECGDRVLASMNGDDWYRRYYSHLEDGYHMCFKNGGDEWSSEGYVTHWQHCKKFEG